LTLDQSHDYSDGSIPNIPGILICWFLSDFDCGMTTYRVSSSHFTGIPSHFLYQLSRRDYHYAEFKSSPSDYPSTDVGTGGFIANKPAHLNP
jgi:hypothetical protein